MALGWPAKVGSVHHQSQDGLAVFAKTWTLKNKFLLATENELRAIGTESEYNLPIWPVFGLFAGQLETICWIYWVEEKW